MPIEFVLRHLTEAKVLLLSVGVGHAFAVMVEGVAGALGDCCYHIKP